MSFPIPHLKNVAFVRYDDTTNVCGLIITDGTDGKLQKVFINLWRRASLVSDPRSIELHLLEQNLNLTLTSSSRHAGAGSRDGAGAACALPRGLLHPECKDVCI